MKEFIKMLLIPRFDYIDIVIIGSLWEFLRRMIVG
jgi:hypothetical protein